MTPTTPTLLPPQALEAWFDDASRLIKDASASVAAAEGGDEFDLTEAVSLAAEISSGLASFRKQWEELRTELPGGRSVFTPDLAALTELLLPTQVGRGSFRRNDEVIIDPACGRITGLTLQGYSLIDVTPISSLSALRRLDLTGNYITDISALAALTELRELWLSGNKISNVQPLASLRHLTQLTLDENLVSDISPLAPLSQLQGLNLDLNRLTDIDVLPQLHSLNWISVGGNRLSDQALSLLWDFEQRGGGYSI